MKRKCPICGKDTNSDSMYCQYCGSQFRNELTAGGSSQKCKVCGSDLMPGQVFCPHCGTRLRTTEPSQASGYQKTQKRADRTILKTMLVIGILLLCFLTFQLLHMREDSKTNLPKSDVSNDSGAGTGGNSGSESGNQDTQSADSQKEEASDTSQNTNASGDDANEFSENEDELDAAVSSAADLGMKIPSDAFTFNGHSYYLYDNDCKDWDDVLNFCESKGGYPVVINDSEENESLFEYMLSMNRSATLIGYTDRDTEGIWRWPDGKTSDFTDWGINNAGESEPNSDSTNEDYAQLDINMHDGHWNDCAFAWDTAAFICEWDSTN